MSTTDGQTDASGAPLQLGGLDPRRWVLLGVLLTAAFMVLLDISIVNVAIPSIQHDLKATFAQIQLVLALYQLTYAVVLITGGRLGDIFGRKRLFMMGMTGFVLASALCGFAPSPTFLVASRVLQGFMASLMFPQVLSIIQVVFPARERAVAFSIFGATIGVAVIVGPLLGGLLINGNLFGLQWRPIFLVNLPVGVASLIAAGVLLRESKAPSAPRLDLVGVAIVSAGLTLLVWPLVEGRDAGWPLWAYACLIASVPVLVLFVLFERRKTANSDAPLVQLALFHNRAFVAGLLVSVLFFSGVPSFFFIVSLYLQTGLGFSALHAGLTVFPFAVGALVASAASARLGAALGRNILSLGCALLVVGLLLTIVSIHQAGIGIQSIQLAPAFFIAGLGLGSVVAPLINVVLSGIPVADAGSASGVLTTTQQLGGAIGVAIIGVVFFGQLASNAAGVGRELAPGLQQTLIGRHIPAQQAAGIAAGFQRCFRDQAGSSDPSAVPASCPRSQAGNSLSSALTAAGTTAKARDFSNSFAVSLLYFIVTFLVTLAVVGLLPKPSTVTAGAERGVAVP